MGKQQNDGLGASLLANPEPSHNRDIYGPSSKARWTTDEARKFVEMYKKGTPVEDIASSMPTRNVYSVERLAWRYRRGDLDQLLRGEQREGASVGQAWTKEEKRLLRKLLEAGVAEKDMGTHFPKRSAAGVQKAARMPSWHPFWASRRTCNWSKTELKYLEESLAQGVDRKEIMRTLKRSAVGVSHMAKKLCYPPISRHFRAEEDAEIQRLCKGGHSF